MELLSRRPKWTRDSDYTQCTRCFLEFGLATRRHHCRRCGQVLCAACAPHFVPVPDLAFFAPVRLCVGCVKLVSSSSSSVSPSPATVFDLNATAYDVVLRRVGRDADALQGVNVFLMQGTSSSARSLAAALLRAGADVFLGAASVPFGRQVGKLVVQMATAALDGPAAAFDAAHERLHVMHLDPAELASVRRCALDFVDLAVPLDALVLNVQLLAPDALQRTADGHELVFQTSFLSGFLLAHLLEDCLAAAPVARVLVATSAAHSFADIDLADLDGVGAYARSFGPWRQFAAVASMNLSFASALDWRYRTKGCNVCCNSIATGAAALELSSNPTSLAAALARRTLLEPTPSFGAAALFAMGLLDDNLPTGRYFVNGAPAEPANILTICPPVGRRLWTRAAALCKLTGDAAVPPRAHGAFASPPTSPAAPAIRKRPTSIDDDGDD